MTELAVPASRREVPFRPLVVWGAAILGTVAIGGVLLVISDANPIQAYRDIVAGSVGSIDSLEQTITTAIPVAMIALGLCVAFRANVWNIGGDGQFLIGALCATAVALTFGLDSALLLLPLALLAGAAGGAVYGGLVGGLRARWNVSEVITSLLLNYLAFYLVTYVVRQPLRGEGSYLPETDQLPAAATLPTLGSTSIHAGIFVLLGLVPVAAYLLGRTPLGFRVRMLGLNPEATKAVGVPTERLIVLTMLFSGGVSGLAGAVQVSGAAQFLSNALSNNFGFTAIVVALLGRLNPIGTVVAGLFIAALTVGGEELQRSQNVPQPIVTVISASFVLLVLVARRLSARPA